MDWYEHYEEALRALRRVEDFTGDAQMGVEPDWLAACRYLGKANEHYSELALHCVQQAYNAGATKKAIADAFGFPASTLRGMVRS